MYKVVWSDSEQRYVVRLAGDYMNCNEPKFHGSSEACREFIHVNLGQYLN